MKYRIAHCIATILIPFLLTGLSGQIAFGQKKKEPEKKETPAATVNGTAIPYSWYQRERLTRLHNLALAGRDSTALSEIEDDAIFLALIDDELTRQEGGRRGITVSRDKAIDILVANPPRYVRDVFLDQKGKFHEEILRDVIKNPEHILKQVNSPDAPRQKIVEQWRTDVDNLIRFYQGEEIRRRLLDTLYADAPLSPADIEHRYFAERTFVEGSVVAVLHSTVPDSLIPISEAEARTWFNTHKEDYRIPESRLIYSLILPVIPSSSDSAEQNAKIAALRSMIESAPINQRLERVEGASASLLPNRAPAGTTISPLQFTEPIRTDLLTAHKGDLVGPYDLEGESLLLYVTDEQLSPDTVVRARHILMRVPPEMTQEEKEGIYGFMTLLRDSIDTEEEFKEAVRYYSDDKQSAVIEGDLGYAGRGHYVPEFDTAVFAAPVGRVVGPIETRYGYHLLWVLDRQARTFGLRELRFPFHASETIYRQVMTDAEQYAAVLRSNSPTDSIAAALKSRYPAMVVDSGTVLKRLEPYGDILSTGEFVFHAEEGDIGIFTLPFDRIGVIQLQQVYQWKDGLPPFEDLAEYPIAHARRKKQLDTLQVRLHDMASKMTPDMLLGPIREMAPMAEVYVLKGQSGISMPEESPTLLDSLITVTRRGQVSGPVRGKHALYFLRVEDRSGPDPAQFQTEKQAYTEQYLHNYRENLLKELLLKARSYATIEDLRKSAAVSGGKGS